MADHMAKRSTWKTSLVNLQDVFSLIIMDGKEANVTMLKKKKHARKC